MEPIDILGIMKYLPHRYPFLLVDRVLDHVPGESLTGIKNVSVNEPFFQGHFPQQPVMPGVLILEALAQATGVLAFMTVEEGARQNTLYMLVSVDKARFKGMVTPGDQLVLQVKLKRHMRNMMKFTCEALVEGKLVAEAEIMCAAKAREA